MPLDDHIPKKARAGPVGPGHNGGPPLEEPPPVKDWNDHCWRRA